MIETASLPAPTTGALAVTSEPPGAMVVVDGVGRGLTPLDLNSLSPGEYRVTLSLVGYLDNAQVVTLVAGSDESLSVMLTSAPQTGVVDASTGGGRNLALIIAGVGGGDRAGPVATMLARLVPP